MVLMAAAPLKGFVIRLMGMLSKILPVPYCRSECVSPFCYAWNYEQDGLPWNYIMWESYVGQFVVSTTLVELNIDYGGGTSSWQDIAVGSVLKFEGLVKMYFDTAVFEGSCPP